MIEKSDKHKNPYITRCKGANVATFIAAWKDLNSTCLSGSIKSAGTSNNSISLHKVPEFPVWTSQKHVEYIKFPINFPIMESKKDY